MRASSLFIFLTAAAAMMPGDLRAETSAYLQLASLSDKDNDGIKNRDDGCPNQPEDVDHFQDNDGCPDPDNDQDGVLDGVDKCPRKPEDRDNFEDRDGCPDPDNDKDGIPDVRDRCPDQKEDVDGFEDANGCPDVDNDKDAIVDKLDKCPNVAEDRDGFQDEDGCPDPDNDGDGILDRADKCPNQAEVFNGRDDDDGCPDQNVAEIEFGIHLLEGVKFSIQVLEGVNSITRSAILRHRSIPVLDSLLKSLLGNTETVFEVIGHTDKSGNPEEDYDPGEDYDLGMEMAEMVCNYWIERGVSSERLTPVSKGSTDPVASNVTPDGREENRRIEIQRIQ